MSFEIDEEISRTTVTIDADTLDRYGYDSAAELIKEVTEHVEKSEPRQFERGYKSGDSE